MIQAICETEFAEYEHVIRSARSAQWRIHGSSTGRLHELIGANASPLILSLMEDNRELMQSNELLQKRIEQLSQSIEDLSKKMGQVLSALHDDGK